MFWGICRLLLPLPPPNRNHLPEQMDKPSRHIGGIIGVLSVYPPLYVLTNIPQQNRPCRRK